MADDTTINPGSGGDTIATDDIGGVKHQRMKVQYGADGSATDVDAAHPLPSADTRTYGYAAGAAPGTVDVPAGARVRRVFVLAAAGAAATVTVAGGAAITVPAGAAFNEEIPGEAAAGGDVVIGGLVQSYYVAWTA